MTRIAPKFAGEMTFRLNRGPDAQRIAAFEGAGDAPKVVTPVQYKKFDINDYFKPQPPLTGLAELAKRFGVNIRVDVAKPKYDIHHVAFNDAGETAHGLNEHKSPGYDEDTLRYTIKTQVAYRGRTQADKIALNQGTTLAADQAIFKHLKDAGVLSDVPLEKLPETGAQFNDTRAFRYDPKG